MLSLELGKQIRAIRKEKKLTLEDVAGDQFTKGYLSQIERGLVTPSFKVIDHISDQLDIEITQLFKMKKEKELDFYLTKVETYFSEKKYNQVIDLYKDIEPPINTPLGVKLLIITAKSQYHLSQYDECINQIKRIINNPEEWSKHYRLTGYLFMANSYFGKQDYTKAVDVYQQVLNFAEENNLSEAEIITRAYLNTATALQNLKKFNEAIKGFTKTLKYAKDHNLLETVLDSFIRLGYCHLKIDNLKMAKKYLYRGLKINKILEKELPQAEALLSLGMVFLKESNYRPGEKVVLKAYQKFQSKDQRAGTLLSLLTVSKIYKEMKKYNLAQDYLSQFFIKLDLKDISPENIKEAANLCMSLDMNKEANVLFTHYISLKSS